jgi:hypothetical protein
VWTKLPEPGEPPALEPAGQASSLPASSLPASAVSASENPLLSRLELELPDGRYLLAYRRLEVTSADA